MNTILTTTREIIFHKRKSGNALHFEHVQISLKTREIIYHERKTGSAFHLQHFQISHEIKIKKRKRNSVQMYMMHSIHSI